MYNLRLIHADVLEKPTQHCKAVITQLNFFKRRIFKCTLRTTTLEVKGTILNIYSTLRKNLHLSSANSQLKGLLQLSCVF